MENTAFSNFFSDFSGPVATPAALRWFSFMKVLFWIIAPLQVFGLTFVVMHSESLEPGFLRPALAWTALALGVTYYGLSRSLGNRSPLKVAVAMLFMSIFGVFLMSSIARDEFRRHGLEVDFWKWG